VRIQIISAVGLFLLAVRVGAQSVPVKVEASTTNDTRSSNAIAIREGEPRPVNTEDLGAEDASPKTQPGLEVGKPVAHLGQWFAGGEADHQFSRDLILVARKDDGRLMWHVEKVNSCDWCGAPLTWKQAMFDRKASSMWALRSALIVADIEITHHSPCFRAGTCREANPLLGPTRLQAYSVGAGLTSIAWITDGWVRKGDRRNHIGGYRRWWIVPVIGYAASAVGIISNIATWHSRN
jgi:hypothetical protein